ncbi:MAG: PD40 domain-containing protein [Armatimonadetes bacterium]|nr:PD40 domain-containing protein [Armatimonadota bacterium]
MKRLLLAGAAFCCLLPAASGQAVQEEFNQKTLHPRWTWRAPVAGPTCSLTERPGWLRMTAPQRPQGFDHGSRSAPVDEAPQLRLAAPAGDWDMEARIQLQQFGPDSTFHAGLMVVENDARVLTWGPAQSTNRPDAPKTPEAWMEPAGTPDYARTPGDATDVSLRLVKRGRMVQGLLRRKAGGWIDGGTYFLIGEPKFLGFILKTASGGAGVTVDIDQVRLTPGKTPLITVESSRSELEALAQQVKGFVVWESNRSGAWELYRINTDGTGFRQLTHLSAPGNLLAWEGALWPRVSPDGKRILFIYGRKGAPGQTWVVSAAGGYPRKLFDGEALNWSPDGTGILFVRGSHLWRYDWATGKESQASDVPLPDPGRGVIGSVGADLKAVQMRTPQANEYFVFDQGKTIKTMAGCESRLTADGRYAYWVQSAKDFRVWDPVGDKEWQILGEPSTQPFNYTYFPTVSSDQRWLVYGASPNQHDHDTSDYEIFLVALEKMKAVGEPFRLSWHPKTDRWPFLWVGK